MDLNTRAWETTLEAAIANTLISSLAMKEHLNSELENRYNLQFNGWKIEVLAGKRDNQRPPLPPYGYIVVKSETGFSYPAQGDVPVCEPRTDIPPDNSQPKPIERGLVDRVNVPAGDTRKAGDVATGAQLIALGANSAEVGDPESLWGRVERAGPFGVYRWYERLS